MQLILRVQTYCGQVPDNTRERSFDSFPIIIGRSTSCDYVLDDLSKYISSNHATVSRQADQLIIEDTSSNGVYLNGHSAPLGRGQIAQLKHGDVLTIGDYLVQVALVVGSAGAADVFSMENPTEKPEVAYDPWNGNEPDFETDNTPIAQRSNDFDDLFDEVDSSGTKPGTQDHAPSGQAADDDDDWFDFGKTGPQPAINIETPASEPGIESPSPESTQITEDHEEDPFDWLTGDGDSDPAPGDNLSTTLDVNAPISGSGAVQLSDEPATNFSDPFSDLPGVDSEPEETPTIRRPNEPRNNPGPTANSQAPAQRPTAGRSPSPSPPAPAHAAPSPPAQSGHISQSANSLETILNAAGLNPTEFSHLDQQQTLHKIGLLLNQSIEGIMLLLQSRGEMKNAIRSDVTMLGSRNNNPLKFSFGSEEAITKLLIDSNSPGYLNSEQAMAQAVDDLKIHQVAMLEAMRSAVRAMLAQFDPQKLEQKLEKNNPLAANIPVKREAKLWQLFQEKFTDIHAEAVNDFGEMFGNEFRKAYEKRLSELGRKPDF